MRFTQLAVFAAGILLGAWLMKTDTASAANSRVFELRIYHTYDGKLDALNARFRDHTTKIFEKHGMHNIGYWVPQDEPASKNTLYYVISHASREQAKKNWDAFRADPDWKKAQAASEVNGKLVEKVESVFMDPVDYSPIK